MADRCAGRRRLIFAPPTLIRVTRHHTNGLIAHKKLEKRTTADRRIKYWGASWLSSCWRIVLRCSMPANHRVCCFDAYIFILPIVWTTKYWNEEVIFSVRPLTVDQKPQQGIATSGFAGRRHAGRNLVPLAERSGPISAVNTRVR